MVSDHQRVGTVGLLYVRQGEIHGMQAPGACGLQVPPTADQDGKITNKKEKRK
jgi:hypothetical protein